MSVALRDPYLIAADLLDPPEQHDRDGARRRRVAADPVRWVETRLSERPWSRQREILEAVRDHRRTAVQSCHNIGKSWVAARIAAWWLEGHVPGEAFVVTSAPTGPQVKAILWREIGRVHARARLMGRTNQTEWWMRMPAGNEEIIAYGRKPGDFDSDAFQGIHAPYVLVIFDEACGMPVSLWDAADTLLSNEDSKILAIGNPDDPSSEFASVCAPGSGWHVVKVAAADSPNFTDEDVPAPVSQQLISPLWVEEKRAKWGESSPMFVAKVNGEFPEVTTDGLVPMAWVRAARDRELPPGEPSEIGMDVGAGGNKSVVAHRRGPVVRVVRKDTEPDTMKSCGNLLADLASTGASRAKVDYYGVGQGVVDRAVEQGAPVLGIRVGVAATDSEKFLNLRAEAYWGLRERFQDGTIDLDPEDDDLAAQLVDLRYRRTSAGKIKIESKDELARRGRESPDEADAVMLAFLAPPRGKAPVKVRLRVG